VQLKNDGNSEGEAANQPGASSLFGDYPESFSAARNFPADRPDDFRRHKIRAGTTYRVDMHIRSTRWASRRRSSADRGSARRTIAIREAHDAR
jgi:hypothetical protein